MKKEISISLLALSLAACGGGSSSSNDNLNGSLSGTGLMSISSYSSDAATDASPVGTWIVILDGTHYTDNVQDWTYQQKEIFTIEEDGENYVINSCDFYQPDSTVSKTDFSTAKINDQTSQNSTSNYSQKFTSNLSVIGTGEYIEEVVAYKGKPASVEKWIESAKGIKINDSIDIQENLSINSQNSDLEKASIELNCFNIAKYSNGGIKLEINSIDNIEIFIESMLIKITLNQPF